MTKFGAMPFRFDAEGKFVFGKARLVSSEIGARCLAAAFKVEGEPPQIVIVARYGIGADKASLAPALAQAA